MEIGGREGLMANWITLLRIVLLFIGIGFIYRNTLAGELIAFGIILIVVLLDWVDGIVARWEHRADETGAVMDILADRIVEYALWVVFADLDLIPVWVPIVVIVRGVATDAVRSVALARGETAFGERTMMRTSLGRWLVSSRASRAVYATAKIITFGYLILYLALTQASGTIAGDIGGWLPVARNLGMGLVYFTVAFCMVRGAPVLIEARRYVKRNAGKQK